MTIEQVGGEGRDREQSQLVAVGGDGKMVGTIKQDAEGMADCISIMAQNAAKGAALTDGTDSYNADAEISNKIYVPYAPYTGE